MSQEFGRDQWLRQTLLHEVKVLGMDSSNTLNTNRSSTSSVTLLGILSSIFGANSANLTPPMMMSETQQWSLFSFLRRSR